MRMGKEQKNKNRTSPSLFEEEIPPEFIDKRPSFIGDLDEIAFESLPTTDEEWRAIYPDVVETPAPKKEKKLLAVVKPMPDGSDKAEQLSQDQIAICRVVSNAVTRKEEVMLARAQDAQLLIQPKAFTFACYPLSMATQELLVDIISHLQSYVTADMALVNPKLVGMINIPLSAKNYPAYRKHYADFRKDLEILWKNSEIRFRWKEEMLTSKAAKQMFVDSNGKPLFNENSKVKTSATLFSGITEDETQPDMQIVTINPLALPFLLYYGKGVGGTQYQKHIVFKMQKKYSRRLYPILMDFVNRPDNQNKMSLKEFREILEIPSSYDNSRIKREIIKPSLEEINSHVEEYRFNMELVTENRINNGKKPSLDTVRFYVTSLKGSRTLHETNRITVLATLQEFADKGLKELCEQACDEIFKRENFQKYMSKVHYYNDQVKSHKISKQDYKNIMLNIIKELSGYDLRTERHIRNAKNYKARMDRMKSIKKIGEI